jgi:signal transduction histidine kinase
MFESARLKLTVWYLGIIMLISIFFSVAYYEAATSEIERVIHRLEQRQQRLNDFFPLPLVPQLGGPNLQELEDAKQRIQLTLIFINAGILLLSGAAAYFLAGRTLKPIKQMVDEQNRFITDASHELRTPLTALRSEMEASLLDKHLSSKNAKGLIASNLEEVVHLQNLSDDLLQLAQYQKPKKIMASEVSLLDVIENSLKKTIPLAKKKKDYHNKSY